jgi:hypothetical protein
MYPGGNTTHTNTDLWLAALNVPDGSSKPKTRVKKSEIVVYPEIEATVPYTDDPFWIDILRRCARKKLPRGFAYADNHLRHRQNNISIVLPDDPAAKAQTMIYFLQENGKLYSKRDQERRRLKDEEEMISQLANNSTSWKCVSYSKNRRATHVRDYVERKYAKLPKKIRDELYTQIEVGFETKYITKDNVVFENGQILHIDGIEANQDDIYYTRPRNFKIPVIPALPEAPKQKIYRHYENWTKYLESYCKYIVSSAKAYHTTIHTTSSGRTD